MKCTKIIQNTILGKSPVQGDPRNPKRYPLDGGIQENHQKENPRMTIVDVQVEKCPMIFEKMGISQKFANTFLI